MKGGGPAARAAAGPAALPRALGLSSSPFRGRRELATTWGTISGTTRFHHRRPASPTTTAPRARAPTPPLFAVSPRLSSPLSLQLLSPSPLPPSHPRQPPQGPDRPRRTPLRQRGPAVRPTAPCALRRPPRAMFRNTFQSGFLSILYSIGSKPLQIWDKEVNNGHIKRLTDGDIQSSVLEIVSTNVSTTYITCPADPRRTLGVKLPFLVMIVKNLRKYFSFEVTVLDDKGVRRRFRASNYQSTTRVKPFVCTMPMRLDEGWNQIQFNLGDFTRRAYGTNYVEALRVQVHANCRLRRVYFSDRLYSEEELPEEFKLYLPVQKGG